MHVEVFPNLDWPWHPNLLLEEGNTVKSGLEEGDRDVVLTGVRDARVEQRDGYIYAAVEVGH